MHGGLCAAWRDNAGTNARPAGSLRAIDNRNEFEPDARAAESDIVVTGITVKPQALQQARGARTIFDGCRRDRNTRRPRIAARRTHEPYGTLFVGWSACFEVVQVGAVAV